jgi:hypothetical protein
MRAATRYLVKYAFCSAIVLATPNDRRKTFVEDLHRISICKQYYTNAEIRPVSRLHQLSKTREPFGNNYRLVQGYADHCI